MYMYCKYYEVSDIRSDSIANSGVALSLQNLQLLQPYYTWMICREGLRDWQLPKFRLPTTRGTYQSKTIDLE